MSDIFLKQVGAKVPSTFFPRKLKTGYTIENFFSLETFAPTLSKLKKKKKQNVASKKINFF